MHSGPLTTLNLDTNADTYLIYMQRRSSWNRQHATTSEPQCDNALQELNGKKKKAPLLNMKMRKSAASMHITANHTHSDLNSISDFQNTVKNVRPRCQRYDNFILSARFYY